MVFYLCYKISAEQERCFFMTSQLENDFSYIKCQASVLYIAHMEPCEGQGGKGELLTK